MQHIKDLLFAVMTVSFVSGIIMLLCPEGNGGIKKTLGFVCSAAICGALISPLVKVIKETDNSVWVPDNTDAAEFEIDAAHTVIKNASELICSELESEILRRYGQNVAVSLELDSSDITSVRILSARICGEGNLDKPLQYVSETLGCAASAG